MSMKLHVVAASDIINKGLDLSYPHNELGPDGLLVQSFHTEKVESAIFVSAPSALESVQETTDVLTEKLEPVEILEQTKVPMNSDMAFAEKAGRKSKKS